MTGLTLSVSDYIKWGNLIKSWATGENRIGQPVPPIPRTIDELKQACESIGITITIPEIVTSLAVVQQGPTVKVLVLPPKEMIEAKEADLKAGVAYPLPPEYSQIIDLPLEIPQARVLDFHALRIGDYTLTNCG